MNSKLESILPHIDEQHSLQVVSSLEELQRSAFAALPVAAFIVQQGEIIMATQGAEVLTGYDVEELQRLKWEEISSSDLPVSKGAQTAEEEERVSDLSKFSHKTGNSRWAAIKEVTILYQKNPVTLITATDIGSWTEAEKNIGVLRPREQDIRQRSQEFLATVSHELRTPLSTIVGFSELLLNETTRNNQQGYTRDLEQIVQAAHQLTILINTMIDAAQIESGRLRLIKQTFSLTDLLADLWQLAVPLAKRHRNRFVIKHSSHVGELYSDRKKLRQTLLYLLEHVSATLSDGTICLQVERVREAGKDVIVFEIGHHRHENSHEEPPSELSFAPKIDITPDRHLQDAKLGLFVTQTFSSLLQGNLIIHNIEEGDSTIVLRIPTEL